jgi:hypothetical protein
MSSVDNGANQREIELSKIRPPDGAEDEELKAILAPASENKKELKQVTLTGYVQEVLFSTGMDINVGGVSIEDVRNSSRKLATFIILFNSAVFGKLSASFSPLKIHALLSTNAIKSNRTHIDTNSCCIHLFRHNDDPGRRVNKISILREHQ